MRKLIISLAFSTTVGLPNSGAQDTAPDRGRRFEDMSWTEAETVLRPDSVVVIPVGAASTEHGPHLKLRNDLTLAEYLTRRIVKAASVVAAPPLTPHYYPRFSSIPDPRRYRCTPRAI
jgi:creatinine amidohydrolase